MAKRITANLENLLSESLEAYYWIGFLLADASICRNRISLCISEIDSDHIFKYAKFIGFDQDRIRIRKKHDVCKDQIIVAIQNKTIVPKIMEKFNINYNKTYNPPKMLSEMTDDQFLSLFIGFIDGDGWVSLTNKDKNLIIGVEIHQSWFPLISSFITRLELITKRTTSLPRINRNCVSFSICKNPIIKHIKKFGLENKLPILNRKWDKVNLNFMTEQEIAELKEPEIIKMYLNKIPKYKIVEKLSTSDYFVKKTITEYNNTMSITQ